MFGRTYSSGFEPDLEDWLLAAAAADGARAGVALGDVVSRSGASGRSPASRPEEQSAILREHATIGRAYGDADLAHDVRLACHGLDTSDNDFVIGLVGRDLHPLSHLVQTMRKTAQTSQYVETLGPFFVGHVLWRSGGRVMPVRPRRARALALGCPPARGERRGGLRDLPALQARPDIATIAGRWSGTIDFGRGIPALLPDDQSRRDDGGEYGINSRYGKVILSEGKATFEMYIWSGTLDYMEGDGKRMIIMRELFGTFYAQVTPISRGGLDGPLRASPKERSAPAKPALERGLVGRAEVALAALARG